MKKRVVSLLLAVALCVSVLPAVSIQAEAAESSWMWPAPGCYVVSSNFGKRDLNNDGVMDDDHTGIDIIGTGATFGQPVVAAKSGTVLQYCNAYGDQQKTGPSGMESYGNYVIVNHGDGTYSIYAHMMQSGIRTSGSVVQGETIGYIGNSGNSGGSHLHFQIFKDPSLLSRVLLNPMPANSNIRINNIGTYSLPNGWPSEKITYIFGDAVPAHNPEGVVDDIVGGDGKIYIQGWAFDRDALDESLEIHVYIGGPAGSGEGYGGIIAGQHRPDVDAAYSGVGEYHGYGEWITTTKRGTQDVYVYGINTGGGTNVELGHRTVTIGEAKENPDYLSQCTMFDASSYVVIKNWTTMKTLPCSKETDSRSADVQVENPGNRLRVTGLCKNTAGNWWYRVNNPIGGDAYIYSGDVEFAEHACNVIIDDVVAPVSLKIGDRFSARGVFSKAFRGRTPKNIVLGAKIVSGGRVYFEAVDAMPVGGTYDLHNSAIDMALQFNELPAGAYDYIIYANETVYELENGAPVQKVRQTILYNDAFEVVGKPETQMPAAPNPITVMLNGKKIAFDQEPEIINGRTMVPVRAVFEAMGAAVDWDDAAKMVSAKLGQRVIIMFVGNRDLDIYENGRLVSTMKMDTTAIIKGGRTLIPARFVAEAFGYKVDWDGTTRTVTISG